MYVVDVDECVTCDHGGCSELATCDNTPGSYKCTCRPGSTGDGFHCEGQLTSHYTTLHYIVPHNEWDV